MHYFISKCCVQSLLPDLWSKCCAGTRERVCSVLPPGGLVQSLGGSQSGSERNSCPAFCGWQHQRQPFPAFTRYQWTTVCTGRQSGQCLPCPTSLLFSSFAMIWRGLWSVPFSKIQDQNQIFLNSKSHKNNKVRNFVIKKRAKSEIFKMYKIWI